MAVFDTSQFMPHGMCYQWQSGVLWLNVSADLIIGLAYLGIPSILLYFFWRRRDLPFPSLFGLFAAFILLCGATHFFSIWIVWNPDYQVQGVLKLATGLISASTALVLLKITPSLLELRSPTELQALVEQRTNTLHNTNQLLQNALVEQIAAVKRSAELQQQLDQSRKAADAANEAKSQFLANMSHEIRTPLSAILGYSDLLSTQLSDTDDLVSVDTIRRNSRYLVEIVNDILDLSKIEAGKLRVEVESVTLVDVIGEVYSLMSVRAQEKNIAFEVEYQGLMPKTIQTDPTRLRQILLNLVSNAIKFTDHGEVRLVVRMVREDSQMAQLQLVVADTGIGMSAMQLVGIFDAFHQADTSIIRRSTGTGLGLTISRQLAELLHGGIEVVSQENEGSTFTLTLELEDIEELELVDPEPLLAVRTEPRPLPDLHGLRVLVVDDRNDIRILAQHIIEDAGGITAAAVDGVAAINRVKKAQADACPFDAIVMDMQMPVMDGFEATRRLRLLGFTGSIIALTAGAMLGEREKCLEVGCTYFMTKPVDNLRLLTLLSENLETAETSRSIAALSSEHSSTDAMTENRQFRLLLVDDNKSAITPLARLLQRNGHAVDMAFDGLQAIEKAVNLQPEVIILDLKLPDINGLEVMERLRKLPVMTDVKFILLSGESLDDTSIQASGFDYYLQKPLELDRLYEFLLDIQHTTMT